MKTVNFILGTEVTSDFVKGEEDIVRKITCIKTIDGHLYMAADGGMECSSCHRPIGTPISLIVPGYFTEI